MMMADRAPPPLVLMLDAAVGIMSSYAFYAISSIAFLSPAICLIERTRILISLNYPPCQEHNTLSSGEE